jgi:hypothetical protein
VNLPAPPRDLGTTGRQWWSEVLTQFELRADELPVLTEACHALDRAAEARAAVAADGMLVQGRFGPKQHPGLAIERSSVLLFSRLLRQMGLPADAAPTARPQPTVVTHLPVDKSATAGRKVKHA